VPPAPVPPASLAEAVGEAGAAEAKLRQIEAALAPDAAFEGLASQLTEQLVSLEDRAAEAHERIERATRMRQLDDLEGRWLSEQTALEGLRKETTERARTIAESLAQVEALSEVWEKTRMQAREALAPAAVSDRIARTLRAARATREKITAYRDEVLALQAEIAGGLGTVSDVLEQTQRAEQVMRGGLFGTDSLPIWTALIRHRDFGETLESAVTAFEHDLVAARDFALGQETRLAVHGVLLLLLVAVALSMRRRAERWASEDEAGAPAARLLVRPYAAAVVVAVIVTPFFYYKPPTYFGACVLLAGLAATLRLIPPLLERGVRPACYALAGFFVLDLVRDGLVGVPLLARLVFLVQMAGAVAVFVWLLNPRRLALLPNSDRRMPLFVFVKRLAIALLAAAIVGSILGYVALSRLVGSGVLRSAYAGVIIYVAYKVLSGMLVVSLRARALQYLNLIRDHRQRTARRLTGLTRFAALAFWLYLSLGYFSVRDPLLAAVSAFLTAPLAVGELEISLGDILALALALIVSVYLSRFVRYVLDEDVLPRLALPRGVPYAISTSAFYVVLMFGVFASLAAAGIDLSRFALLAGALGVGIGFGLQNVVNNFVSGLILLFERPIKTGDTIAVGELMGEVRRIGIRSSTVRTWEGAEVIVPNANLVSDQVINWTLSDHQRRINVEVGVRYGTDPERVLALLLEIAEANDRILERPEPTALFLGFGASSLDFRLRAWTAHMDSWVQIRSDLTVAVNRALAEAGIEIPFPQRDLHLRSVDAAAGRALREAEAPAEPASARESADALSGPADESSEGPVRQLPPRPPR
jgi:small-conductance mechanosensitive channel